MSGSIDRRFNVSWMIRRDTEEVLRIERGSFANPWDEEAMVRQLRERGVIGMVVRIHEHHNGHSHESIGGFMVYRLHKKRLELIRLAVDPARRRQGIGRMMIDKLKGKLTIDRRSQLTIEVRETNVEACLFLKANGFHAVSVLRSFFDDTGEDAYLFRWRCMVEQSAIREV